MLIESLVVGPWATNCYLVAADGSSQVVVIDPGVDAASRVRRVLSERGWALAGVIATHGHVDHIGDAARLANEVGVPMWMHSADDYMLLKPSSGLGPGSRGMMQALYQDRLPAPQKRVDLADTTSIDVAGLYFDVLSAPGHTPGCVILTAATDDGPIAWTGDVVFDGSIGRTDLPGGDLAAMSRTLRSVVLPLDDAMRLLPGHGPATTMRRERFGNPYLEMPAEA
ncbi:MAG: MBL fold metallo-hydrolase [Propionibacteriaceae bacterium]|nr:MBL fold metallo-hydrolase [Propionibacteriaceae bacterium]